MTVCTGSAILAKTGVLDGKRATSNKKAFAWVSKRSPTSQHPSTPSLPISHLLLSIRPQPLLSFSLGGLFPNSTQVKEQNTNVHWVPKARWVVDGNIWTSSGISAGIDLIYAWIAEVWGEEKASYLADSSEYGRNKDSGDDRFAERWGVV